MAERPRHLAAWCAALAGAGALAVAFVLLVKAFPVDARAERVLYIEGTARWEYRYLRNFLLREEGPEAQCFLYSAPTGFLPPSSDGLPSLEGFPENARGLSGYRLVILGDLPRTFFERHPGFAAALCEYVRSGGGLVTIAGGRLETTPDLDAVLPVALGGPSRTATARPSSIALTDDGVRNDLLRLAETSDESREAWERGFPELYSIRRVSKVKDGATVLAVAAKSRCPFLVLGRLGEGRSLFVASDELWRWRASEEGNAHYRRFWNQVIERLGHRPPGWRR